MKLDITIEHLVMLVAILFIIYFMMTAKENFEQINSKPKDRSCAQESINYAYLDYVFGGIKSPRQ